jgi:hypothetical protein
MKRRGQLTQSEWCALYAATAQTYGVLSGSSQDYWDTALYLRSTGMNPVDAAKKVYNK